MLWCPSACWLNFVWRDRHLNPEENPATVISQLKIAAWPLGTNNGQQLWPRTMRNGLWEESPTTCEHVCRWTSTLDGSFCLASPCRFDAPGRCGEERKRERERERERETDRQTDSLKICLSVPRGYTKPPLFVILNVSDHWPFFSYFWSNWKRAIGPKRFISRSTEASYCHGGRDKFLNCFPQLSPQTNSAV